MLFQDEAEDDSPHRDDMAGGAAVKEEDRTRDDGQIKVVFQLPCGASLLFKPW